MPTDSQDKLAHCRGIRRMHLRSNAPACVRAPGSHIRFICVWLFAMPTHRNALRRSLSRRSPYASELEYVCL